MRDVMLRGWDITHTRVYTGVIASSAWILIFLLFSWVIVRIKF